MKQLCIDNELPYWDEYIAFKMMNNKNHFEYCKESKEFYIKSYDEQVLKLNKTEVTEQEFINLLNTK